MKKLTRKQAVWHRLIWRYVVQNFKKYYVLTLKLEAVTKYSIETINEDICILCDVYRKDNCQGCPLTKGEKRCYNYKMLYDLVSDGDIEAAKTIRDIKLNVEPK